MDKTISLNGWDIIAVSENINLYSNSKESIATHNSEICLTISPTTGPGAEGMIDIKIGDITLSISGDHKVVNVFHK